MKKISLVLFLLMFISQPIFANVYDYPANLKTISSQIPRMGSIRCKFRQEKHLQNILKPIISYGDFEFSENEGVRFWTQYPIKSTIDYTNKNYKQVNDIVCAISAKKYSKLEKEFSFFFEGNSKEWTLGMKPKKNSNAYDYITSITIDGGDYIQVINIQQTNGNNTTLWFTK